MTGSFRQARSAQRARGEASRCDASPLARCGPPGRGTSAFAHIAAGRLRLVRAAVLLHHAREAGLTHALRGLLRRAADDAAAPDAHDVRLPAALPRFTAALGRD